MNKLALTSLVSLNILLAACSDNQDATKSNFTKAIDTYAAHGKVCLPIDLTLQNNQYSRMVFIGNQEIRIPKEDANGKNINKNALQQMHILVDAGLYQKEDDEHQEDSKAPIAVFRRTTDSQDAVVNGQNSQTVPLLCIGKQKVEDIVLFTQPTPDNGMLTSKVIYDANLVLEKWAKKLLKARSNDWKDKIDQPQRMSATLVLTNEGWKDIRAIQ